MKKLINEIFDVKDIVWFVLGLIIPVIYNFVKVKFLRWSIRRKIKKEEISFNDNGIVSLGHGDPFYIVGNGRTDIDFARPLDLFYISMPIREKEEILKYNAHFFNTSWDKDQCFLDGQGEEEMLEEIASVLSVSKKDIKKIYNEEKINVAKLLLSKVEQGSPYFNGEMYGIKRIQSERLGNMETATISVSSYKTDYYTHRVMAAIYQRVYSVNRDIVPDGKMISYNKMRYFLTSMGMNVLLILEDENKVVFAKRSGALINMSNSLWHDSMNEAVSITDLSDINDNISLEKCIIRGLNEELGIDVKNPMINYGDLFFLKNPFETGISAFVLVRNLSLSELKIAYSAAKDKELETEDIIAIPFQTSKLKDFIEKKELTDTAQYMIKMLLARHIKGAI